MSREREDKDYKPKLRITQSRTPRGTRQTESVDYSERELDSESETITSEEGNLELLEPFSDQDLETLWTPGTSGSHLMEVGKQYRRV